MARRLSAAPPPPPQEGVPWKEQRAGSGSLPGSGPKWGPDRFQRLGTPGSDSQELPGGAWGRCSLTAARERGRGGSPEQRPGRSRLRRRQAPFFLPVLAHTQLPLLGSLARNEPTGKRTLFRRSPRGGRDNVCPFTCEQTLQRDSAEPGARTRPVRSGDICPLGAVTRRAGGEENVMGELWGAGGEGSSGKGFSLALLTPSEPSLFPRLKQSISVSY